MFLFSRNFTLKVINYLAVVVIHYCRIYLVVIIGETGVDLCIA